MTETFDIPALPYNDNKNKNDTPFINNVKVKYVCTKSDKFGKDISYFKVTSEIKTILSYLNDGEKKCPFWVSDDGLILKVNNKFVPSQIDTRGQFYEVFIEMVDYEFQPKDKEMIIKGYYAKLYI